MHLNLFIIGSLLTGITSTLLAILLVTTKPKSEFHYIYTLECLSIATWGFGALAIGFSRTSDEGLFAWKIAYSGVILIAPFFLHSVSLLVTDFRREKLIKIAYFQAVIFILLLWFDQLITSIEYIFDSIYYAKMRWRGFISFIAWLSIVCYGTSLLIKDVFAQNKAKRKDILFFLVSAESGFIAGVTNFLPVFGIRIYPLGNLFIPFFVVIIAYAIFRFQVLNINLIVRRSLIYSCLISIMTISFLLIIMSFEYLIRESMGYRSLLISLFSASLIATIFIPLKNRIQFFIDVNFLGKTPEQIAQENELLRQELMRSEKLKAVAAFASGMAHEIKNPLTALKTFAEYLPQKAGEKDFVDKFSKIVSEETEKIDKLVHQLLDFSKPASLKLKEADLHQLLADTLELLSSEFIKNRIRVEKNFFRDANYHESDTNNRELVTPSTSPSSNGEGSQAISGNSQKISGNSCIIKLDAQQIKQVFLNLFLNAIEAMPAGGTLTVTTKIIDTGCKIQDASQDQKPASCIMNPASGKVVEVCVQDTGCGIPEKDLPNIFEPFYTTKEKGSGLGLSIVHNIIKEHHGSIWVESKIRQWTKFMLELPMDNN